MLLILIVFLPFLGSLIAAFLPSNARNAEAWLAGLVAMVCTGLTISLLPTIIYNNSVHLELPWMQHIGLFFVLRMDGYVWLLSLIIGVMGALVALYACYYLSPGDPAPRFFSFFQAFMGAMLGIILSGNLIQLICFWEITSLASFMLIAYWHHCADARKGAHIALSVTSAGGLCLLAGALFLGRIVGSYDLDQILQSGHIVQAHPYYHLTLMLIVLGTLTKSAQFPFHFWLPNAMSAPTPVSAYLHSATLVKVGIFLLARLWPTLAGTNAWFWLISSTGLVTLVTGALAAFTQRDMKGVLAYSTISHLGLVTLLLGMNRELGLVAAIFHMVNHATFKASLFMAAGIVEHETGTRDLTRLSGLYRVMPITATLAMVAAASMAGVPLLNGFISKEMFFAETIFISGDWWTRIGLPLAAVLAGIFSVAYSLRFTLQVFLGLPATNLPYKPHEPPYWMLFPSALLVLICLVVGILPGLTLGPFLDIVAYSILEMRTPVYNLAIWHGWTLPLLMSFVALAVGAFIYYMYRKIYSAGFNRKTSVSRVNKFGSLGCFFRLVHACTHRVLCTACPNRLQAQMAIIVISTWVVSVTPLTKGNWLTNFQLPTSTDPLFTLIWVVGGACAIGSAYQAKYHRLASLILCGGAGLMTCITFVWFSAPDLALTQLVVEIVTVVLILLGLRWLPRRIQSIDRSALTGMRVRSRRVRDLVVAVLIGSGMASLAYAVMMRPEGNEVSTFFIKNASLLGNGNNIVNVILVDFRGFDTFGEITVLGIVSLTIYALLRRFRPSPESLDLPYQKHQKSTHYKIPNLEKVYHAKEVPPLVTNLEVPGALVRLLLPVTVLVSVYYLLRGHDEPGGGFVGGIMMATAIILQYMVEGTMRVESRSHINPQYWIGWGLICAAIAALSSWYSAQSFLSAQAWELTLPFFGNLSISSVLIFDVGVFLLVVGATVLVLVALAHQSLRAQRALAAQKVDLAAKKKTMEESWN